MAKSEEQKAQKAAPAPEQEGVTEQTTVMAPLSDEAVKSAAEAEKAKDEKAKDTKKKKAKKVQAAEVSEAKAKENQHEQAE